MVHRPSSYLLTLSLCFHHAYASPRPWVLSDEPPSYYVAPCLALFTILLMIPLNVLYYRARNVFPLKERDNHAFLFVLTSCMFLYLLSVASRLLGSWCVVTDAISFITTLSIASAYMQQSLVVLFKFRITYNIADIMRAEGMRRVTEQEFGWFLRHRHLMFTSVQLYLRLGIELFIVVACIISILLGPAATQKLGPCNGHKFRAVILVNNTLLFVFGICSGVCGCMFRSFQRDGMQLKLELIIMGFTGCLFVLAYLVGTVVAPKGLALGHLLTELFWLLSLVSSYVIPLAIAYRPNVLLKVDMADLQSTLESTVGRDAFLQFLATEFSVENLLFWESVNFYKEGARTDPDLQASAISLYDKFISPTSRFTLNISAEASRTIRARLVQDDDLADLFDAAQLQTWRLMLSDSFPRFQLSKRKRELEGKLKQGFTKELSMQAVHSTDSSLSSQKLDPRLGDVSYFGELSTQNSSASLFERNRVLRGTSAMRRLQGPSGDRTDDVDNSNSASRHDSFARVRNVLPGSVPDVSTSEVLDATSHQRNLSLPVSVPHSRSSSRELYRFGGPRGTTPPMTPSNVSAKLVKFLGHQKSETNETNPGL